MNAVILAIAAAITAPSAADWEAAQYHYDLASAARAKVDFLELSHGPGLMEYDRAGFRALSNYALGIGSPRDMREQTDLPEDFENRCKVAVAVWQFALELERAYPVNYANPN